ncbi:hypothetical protein F5884DRAFT_59835 [Xylogone sp. PMI_703]|nr:hypothetical protein F5884DRAFT_59835 [Xylogone sp. PMI_703]
MPGGGGRSSTMGDTPPVTSPLESPFPDLSQSAGDRVFPIRSQISVDPSNRYDVSSHDNFPGVAPPMAQSETRNASGSSRRMSVASGGSTGHQLEKSNIAPPVSIRMPADVPSIFSGSHPGLERRKGSSQAAGQIFSPRSVSSKSESAASVHSGGAAAPAEDSIQSSQGDDNGPLVTARFKHIVTDEGHAIITGRDGETLQRCEDEPIHIPGAVQGFGLLIALEEQPDGKLIVRIVSENSRDIIGYTPKQLFALDSFVDILSAEQADNLLDHVDFVRDADADPATNGPEVFNISIRSPSRHSKKLWCAIHMNERNPGLIICEFELEDDQVNPLVWPSDISLQEPEDTLDSNPSAEELAESTVTISRPLRVLRSARRRRGEAAAMEVFNIMSQIQEQLNSAQNIQQFLKILVGIIKELTGFHRVMIYQFDQSFNGRVVTELVDPRATKDLYKGLNFPASDIPKQARDLYKINKVRLLYDRDQDTARLVCRTIGDLETPLDLTYSYLRAMSPIHIKYLANMAVRASMSISLNAFDELWGLISCHSYGAKGMRVSFPIRKMCRLIGDSASRNIERLSYASRLQARKLINTVPTEHNPSGYIIASSDDLLKLFDADYGLLSIGDETKILGRIENSHEVLAMLEYLRVRRITSVLASQDIGEDFPDLKYPPGFQVIAGLLLVPLSVGGVDFIVFFRKGQLKEVKWAGNPYEKFIRQGTEGYLEPRKSFKTWSETIMGKCREWTEEQVETAAVLCLVYGKFIEVWRQKEAALQSSQLTRLLLANSAHEVRTPLNAIINYLEIALEGSLDQETRENLARSHSASKSLIYVINDLLDLTKTEEGHDLVKEEVFDLHAAIKEGTDVYAKDAERKQLEFQVVINPGVPVHVIGDQRRVQQALSNVTANAIYYTKTGAVKVEIWLADQRENHVDIDFVIQDTGIGMSSQKLDELFRELEQVSSEADDALGISQSSGGMEKKAITQTGKDEKGTLGLGLAVVSRIVRTMNGQLRLKSEQDKGSRFVIQLPFQVPGEKATRKLIQDVPQSSVSQQPPTPPTPRPVDADEVTLVESTPMNKSENAVVPERRHSSESMNSLKTTRSQSSGKSAKSDVDRLIDAIQEPHMVLKPPIVRRSGSRGQIEGRGSPSSTRPQISKRSLSHGSDVASGGTLERHISQVSLRPGEHPVTDSGVPIKPVKIPEESKTPTSKDLSLFTSGAVSEVGESAPVLPHVDHLRVLVAEDDPINSKIIKKRLEKASKEVQLTVNGQECATAYGDNPEKFDVVLMDIQMPIVDGLTSTKMIRSFEKTHPTTTLSPSATHNGRIPIFAVSASLAEKDRQMCIDCGFDGWILKPIDFNRLNTLMKGIMDEDIRQGALYVPGEWEKGGWFEQRRPDRFQAMMPSSENMQ